MEKNILRIKYADNKKKEVVQKVKVLFAKCPDVTIVTVDGVRAVMERSHTLKKVF